MRRCGSAGRAGSDGFTALAGSLFETATWRQQMGSESTQTKTKAATAWVVALTAIGSLMAALDTLVVSTALSSIRLDLGASVEGLEWTVNAYNLSFAVLLITGAAI